MLRIHGGLSEAPKPGCSGTITSKCLESRSNTGSQTGRPLAPCRNSSGVARAAPAHPHRHVAHLVARQLAGHALPSLFWSRNVACRHEQMPGKDRMTAAADTERFRLRRFVERLVQLGECDIHDKPIDLGGRGGGAGGQPARRMVQGGGPGEGGADRQRDGVAQAAGAGARHRRGRPDAGAGQAARQPGEAGEGRSQGRAGPAGGEEGRGRRSLRAAGASAARRGRRALHLRRARLRDLPRQRLDQRRLPPHHAARPARRPAST